MKSYLLTTVAVTTLVTGCVGYNHTLFMTKSNAGLDFDVKPPTAEINISRKEGVVAPTFEGGQTPPVMASFGSKSGSGGGLGRFFFGVDQTFAGGDAAVTMAKLYSTNGVPAEDDASSHRFNSALTLSQLPKGNKPGVGKIRRFLFGLPEPGEVKPFVFGTDTQLGVKVGWTGVGGPYPETVKIGFNRKEVALAPVTLIKDESGNAKKEHKVEMPSFLATVDTDVAVSGDVHVTWMQYFATGESADHLARQPAVRQAMLQRADPLAAAVVADSFEKDPAGDCLRGFWKPDGVTVNTNNQAMITAWMATNRLDTSSITMFLRGSKHKKLREKAVKDLGINCGD